MPEKYSREEYEKVMEPFFTRNKNFYRNFFHLVLMVALQNLVAYSVNMLDNMMLGSYSQNALSGAATVNQIFFVINQLAIALGSALIVMGSQYWGKGDTGVIRKLTGIALVFSMLAAVLILAICAAVPRQLIGLFTTSSEIIEEGQAYLGILKWTFVLFLISNLLISMLRSVETVRISFIISVVSLLANGGINYTLIFGHFGFPEMGIRGAAIGTLIARSLEFLIVLFYVIKVDKKVQIFRGNVFREIFSTENKKLWTEFIRVSSPVILSNMLWSISVPMQTAILGHLSADAIAANSVATTFFQYLKVIVIAIASASSVVIGKSIGEGDRKEIRAAGRTLSVLDVCIGILLAVVLLVLRKPLLTMYNLTDTAMVLADHLMIIMSIIMVGMSYQMPVSVGIIQGGGDTRFNMYINLISTWGIVMPLSFLAAFVWKLPVEWVVVAVQSDQIFKGLPIFLRFRSYKWIRNLT